MRTNFTVNSDAEITLEVNPGTVTRESLNYYRALGINRISIGIQSFDDDELKFLSRIHNAEDGYRAFSDSREAGFTNVSIDLIYGLPEQDMSSWTNTLEKGTALIPEHISAYNLTIEKDTPLGKLVESGMVLPLSEESEASFFLKTMEFLKDKGYTHYEVSNYARPGFFSRHNMNYWNHANYLGLGPSAHSLWLNKRWWNVPYVNEYIDLVQKKRRPVSDSEVLSSRQLLDETIMMGLRTGYLNFDKLNELDGGRVSAAAQSYFNELKENNLALIKKNGLFLTLRGFLYCDEIAKQLSIFNQ